MLNGKVKRELKSLIKKLRLPEQEDFNTIDLITYFDFEEDHVRVKKLPILLYALYHETLDQSLGDVEDPLDKDPYIYLKGCFNEKQFDDCLGRGPRVVSDLLKTFGIEENTCTQCPGLYCKLEGGNDKERINQCRSEINKFRGLMKLCRLYLGWRLRG